MDDVSEELRALCQKAWDALGKERQAMLIRVGVTDPVDLLLDLEKAKKIGPIRTFRARILLEEERDAYIDFLALAASERKRQKGPVTEIPLDIMVRLNFKPRDE